MDQITQDKDTIGKHWSHKWFLRRMTKRKNKNKLPPEMEEAILARISDQNTLLKCRRVCSLWKLLIDTLLEQRRLSNWSAWNLKPYVDLLHPPIWVVSRTECSNHCYCSSHICRPPALKTGSGSVNPFPHKSATLMNCDHWHKNKKYKNVCPNRIYKRKETFNQFFTKSGNFLTSLVLHYVFLKHCDFSMILTTGQNLKALSLYDVTLLDFEFDMNVRVSPQLKHLQVFDKFVNLDWLINILNSQLVSLKLVQNYVNAVNPRPVQFSKLKQLYIYNDDEFDLKALSSHLDAFPNLEYFTATGMELSLSRENMEDFINSLSGIATSLVYFRLRICTLQIPGIFEECGIVFPNVKFLVLVRCLEEPEISKEEILQWFPKVKSVTFNVDAKWVAHDFDVGRECFVCDKQSTELKSQIYR